MLIPIYWQKSRCWKYFKSLIKMIELISVSFFLWPVINPKGWVVKADSSKIIELTSHQTSLMIQLIQATVRQRQNILFGKNPKPSDTAFKTVHLLLHFGTLWFQMYKEFLSIVCKGISHKRKAVWIEDISILHVLAKLTYYFLHPSPATMPHK